MLFFDIIIIGILIFFAIKGLKNGLIIELGSLLAFIAGYFLTNRFSHFVYNQLQDKDFPLSEYLPIISYSITFILIVIAVFFIAKLLTSLAKLVKINWLNKICGFVFGSFKALLIVGGLFLIIDYLKINFGLLENLNFQESYLYNPIINITKAIFPVFF